MNVWKSWAESKGLNGDIVKYEAKELDECLSQFFAEKNCDRKLLSFNLFMLFVFNGLCWFHKKLSIISFVIDVKRL